MSRRRTAIFLGLSVIGVALLIIFRPRPLVTGSTLDRTDEPQIAYMAYGPSGLGEVYVYDSASRTQVQITRTNNHVTWASWSPDGRYLAFNEDFPEADTYSVYRYDVESGDVLRLTPPQAPRCFFPAWSPDGSQIACSDARGADPGDGEVFLVAVDGSEITPLARGSRPAWSADGSRLIFTTRRDPLDPESVDIATIDRSSGAVEFLAELEGVEYKPQWSPDGRQIAYVENNYHSQGGLESQTLKLRDGETVTVVQTDMWDGSSDFEFSSDGRTLRFLDCLYDIQSAEGTCGGAQALFDSPIVYSPDGSQWALTRDNQICVTPSGEYACTDLPAGTIRLLGWRP